MMPIASSAGWRAPIEFVIRTPDLKEMITALDTVLATPASAPAPVAVQPPEFERERASRTMVQLERQAAAAASARQQCATLSAELAVLNAISEAITQDKDIDVVLREILAACCDAGGVSIGALYLATPRTARSARSWSAAAPARETTARNPFLGDESRLRRILDRRTRTMSRSTSADSDGQWLDRSWLESALVVPLQHKEATLGALVMMSEIADLGIDDRLVFAEAVGPPGQRRAGPDQAFEDSATAARRSRESMRALLESVFTSINDPDHGRRSRRTAPSTWNRRPRELIGADALRRSECAQIPTGPAHIGVFHADKATPFCGRRASDLAGAPRRKRRARRRIHDLSGQARWRVGQPGGAAVAR